MLSSAEAARRLAAEGPNALPGAARKTTLGIALGVVREPMFLLLIGAGAVYLVLGSLTEALALLFSGLSSSTVGTMAGQVIIEGFLDIKFSVFLRRLITIIPAVVVIALKLDPLQILVLSQVALSFAIPFALVPLVMLTRNRLVMGDMVNTRRTNLMAYVVTGIIVALNLLLLYRTVGGEF